MMTNINQKKGLSRERLGPVALGREYADICLHNCRIVDLTSSKIIDGDIAIKDGLIAAIGGGFKAKEEIDCNGGYICPSFIDAHIHIESTLLTPLEFSKAVVPHGTGAVVADPHEIANCNGLDGIYYMIETTKGLPIDFYFTAPSCVPATHLETSGARLGPGEIEKILRMERVVALGELMNFPGVIEGDEEVWQKIKLAHRLSVPIDGHAPKVTGNRLCAYVGAGIDSDHECTEVGEAEEKLSLGMYLYLREGTTEKNLKELLPVVTSSNAHRCCIVSDDRHPYDLIRDGHLDHMLKIAVKEGLDPFRALSMVTINPALRYGIKGKGLVAPGFFADLVMLKDLEDFSVEWTMYRGDMVYQNGQLKKALFEVLETPWIRAKEEVNIPLRIDISSLDFVVPLKGKKIRVIGIVEGQIITQHLIMDVKGRNGEAISDSKRDILKIAVVERHGKNGNVGIGFVHGFGLKEGAIASTVAHDSHNFIVTGVDDRSMKRAVAALVDSGGGLCVTRGEEVLAHLPLPVAGLMTSKPVEEVAKALSDLMFQSQAIGANIENPFMALSFLALPVIPHLKITDMGLVDVDLFEIVPLFI